MNFTGVAPFLLSIFLVSCVPQRELPPPRVEPTPAAVMELPPRRETDEELQSLADTARKRGAVPPVLFSHSHGVTVKGDAEALRQRVASAKPGETLVIPDGVYVDLGKLELAADGKEDEPIVLKAATLGKVVFTGQSSLLVTGDYWVLEGLLFDEAVYAGSVFDHILAVHTARGVRVTQCAFLSCGSPDVKYVAMMQWGTGATDGRVDHCTFVDSLSMNLQIRVGPQDADSAKRIRVDHNHFRDIRRRHINGGEAVQIGGNPMKWGKLEANAVVEHNRFERCDGDDEVISNKSSENIIRNNTFLGCGGALWLRGGENCVVEHNLFHKGYMGIVTMGNHHRIAGNILQETHSYGILIQYGSDHLNVEHAGLSFEVLSHSIIEGNAFLNPVRRGLVYGAHNQDRANRKHLVIPPHDNVLKGNVLIGETTLLLMAHGFRKTEFEDNVYFQSQNLNQDPFPEGFAPVSEREAQKRIPALKEMTASEVGASWLR